MYQLKKVALLITLFFLIEQSIQSRNELYKIIVDSITKKQERNRWLTKKIEPFKSEFETAFTYDQIASEDAKMLVYLVYNIRGLQDKLTSPPIYWYSRKG